MSGNQSNAHRYREVAINTANPLQLVVILYDAAIHSLQEAQEHIKNKDIPGRSRCINRCVSIISELQVCLNFKEGGEISQSLDSLYNYMKQRIFKANVEQSSQKLNEVLILLENLRSAWSELAGQAAVSSPSNSKLSERGFLDNETITNAQPNSFNLSG